MAKKNKKAIARRKEKRRQRRKQRRQQARAPESARTSFSAPPPGADFIGRPSMADIEPPEGFRPIGMAQAMMEFAKPIMERAADQDVQDPNQALQIAMGLWNYGLAPLGRKVEPLKDETIRQIRKILQLTPQEAEDFFASMVERKNHLFPPDVQPRTPMIMFIRKETSHLIAAFNYGDLSLADDPVPPDDEDRAFVAALDRLDRYIAEGTDYGEWEDHFFSMRDSCEEQFYQWLLSKGTAEEYSEDFPGCVPFFLDFVYTYGHFGADTLKNVSAPCIDEFFSDFLLRKVTVEPHEYTHWPPALKLFYRFLHEKGYLKDPAPAIRLLDAFEPRFIEMLRKQYS